VLVDIHQHHDEVMESLLGKINDLRIPSEKDITPKTKMLSDQRGNLYDGNIERDDG
jgi:hypothetical protein